MRSTLPRTPAPRCRCNSLVVSVRRFPSYTNLARSAQRLGLIRAVVDSWTTGTPRASLVGENAGNVRELMKLVALLPSNVKGPLEGQPDLPHLIEVVLDLGRPPLARFPGHEIRLSEDIVTAEDLAEAVAQVGHFDTDNRAGINGTLHRISCIRNRQGKVVGLTCRAGRAIEGSASLVEDVVREGKSILLLGRPGVGKTTAIREISRMLADVLRKRTVIVDTSNEIGGDGDIPHPGIGDARRMQVPRPEVQHLVMIEAVENHMPQVIIIDEIGTEAECLAARTIAQRGVQLVATAHGNALENVIKNPSLSDLVGGIQSVTLGDDTARKRGMQKSILERAHPPTFDVAVEMIERGRWRVHMDVGATVDEILAGGTVDGQVRERDPVTGRVRGLTFVGTVRKVSADGSSNQMEQWVTGTGEEVLKPLSPGAQVGSRLSTLAQACTGKLPSPSSSLSSLRVVTLRNIISPLTAAAAAHRAYEESTTSAEDLEAIDADMAGDTQLWPSSTMLPADSADANSSPHSGATVKAKGQRFAVSSAVAAATAEGRPMRLFLVLDEDVSDELVYDILCSLAGPYAVELVDDIEDAEVAVASRTRMRNDPKVKDMVRRAGVPLYAVRGSSAAGLARDLCPLLGLDPIKARSVMAEATVAAVTSVPAAATASTADSNVAEGSGREAGPDSEATPARAHKSTQKRGRADNLSSADSHAELMDSLVREVHGPVDRELAARLLGSFLLELNSDGDGTKHGGCHASSLSTVAWALGKTKNKRKFLDSERPSLELLAQACSARWTEFSPRDLLRLATGFGALRFAPSQPGWVASLLEHCSSADALGSYRAESRDTLERFTDNLLTLEVMVGEVEAAAAKASELTFHLSE